MAMTKVRVRAQAHGGKYLGPAVKTTPPVLTVFIDGQQVGQPQTFPTLSSGTVVSEYAHGVSPHTIIVQPEPGKSTQYYPTPGTYWLQAPPDGQADLIVSLDLLAPTVVEFRVTAFTSDNENHPVYGACAMMLIPGVDHTSEPGLVVPVYGLRVFGVTALYNASRYVVDVTATVEMMCGCPITQQPRITPVPSGTEPYWPSTEFQVTALFLQSNFPLIAATATMHATTTTSEFKGSASVPKGTYVVAVSATQPGFINSGAGTTPVIVP